MVAACESLNFMIVGGVRNSGINHDGARNGRYGVSLAVKTKKARTMTGNML